MCTDWNSSPKKLESQTVYCVSLTKMATWQKRAQPRVNRWLTMWHHGIQSSTAGLHCVFKTNLFLEWFTKPPCFFILFCFEYDQGWISPAARLENMTRHVRKASTSAGIFLFIPLQSQTVIMPLSLHVRKNGSECHKIKKCTTIYLIPHWIKILDMTQTY